MHLCICRFAFLEINGKQADLRYKNKSHNTDKRNDNRKNFFFARLLTGEEAYDGWKYHNATGDKRILCRCRESHCKSNSKNHNNGGNENNTTI